MNDGENRRAHDRKNCHRLSGAVFSGFAMVLTLMIITRKVLKFEEYITLYHIEAMCKVIIVTSSIVGLAYMTELFNAWYSGNIYEQAAFLNRIQGHFSWAYWTMITCNVISPQFFWFKKLRTNPGVVFLISIVINIGMWFERFVIIVTSIHRDYLPSSWAMYQPTWVEIVEFVGTFGLFFTLFFLFVRFLPVIAMGEVKAVLKAFRGGTQNH